MQIGSKIVGAKFAAISGTGNAAPQQVVAAVTGKKIRVLGYLLTTSDPGLFQWLSGPSTALSGANMTSSGVAPILAPLADCGWFETASGAALNLVVSDAIPYRGNIVFELVSA